MQEMSRCEFLRGLWVVELLLWLAGCPLLAQPAPDASVTSALRSLNARAGAAFVGEVVAVRPLGGIVEVEFAVEQPVKGLLGQSYVLREWGGLWAGAQRRYWVGERALVFLHEPGLKGLSSPVDGMEGVLPVSVAAESSALEVDVQRLRARVARQVGAPMSEAKARVAVLSLTTLLRERVPTRPIAPLPPNRGRGPVLTEEPAPLLREVEVVKESGDEIQ